MNFRRWLVLPFFISMLACQLTGGQTTNPEALPTLAETASIPTATALPQLPTPPLETVPPSAAAVPTPTETPLPPTAVPTSTNTPTPPSPTALPTIINTLSAWKETTVIGTSVQGRPIEATRLGLGQHWFVILAAIHGAHECNTSQLAQAMLDRLTAETTILPPYVTLYIVPLVNPDGCALNSRYNANSVDLNRNWETGNWTADAEGPGGVIAGSGGPFPFSEPETAALHGWLELLRGQSPDGELRIISYHSIVSTGLAQPAYAVYGQPEPRSEALAQSYAAVTGYLYSAVWVGNYTITGELIHWAGENGLMAFDVELPDGNTADTIPNGRTESHIETNLRGLLAVMNPE